MGVEGGPGGEGDDDGGYMTGDEEGDVGEVDGEVEGEAVVGDEEGEEPPCPQHSSITPEPDGQQSP